MDDTPPPSNLNQQAIYAALELRWDEAVKLNKQILKLDSLNIDALNRIAKAYIELGRCNLAKKFYNQVLESDPYNPIASKNLKIIKSFKTNGMPHSPINGQIKLTPLLFLQEPGKTKIVHLLKVAEPQKLSSTYCGMQVEMVIKNRKVIIVDTEGGYLGVLPDDICHHLIRLIKGGNKFDLIIKSIRVNGLSVLIRETYRSKRFKNQPSFLESSSNIVSTGMITALDSKDDSDEEAEETEEETV